jgi:hypothetical protein
VSKKMKQHYYDDEGIMSMVDYSTPRSSQDLSSPNAPRQQNGNQPSDTVIVPSSPVHQTTRVIDDNVFITERVGPIELKSGETIDMLSLTGEAGDIISIEVVTDNPYAGVYLEMDDYKNREVVGLTAAELIMRNKVTPHPKEFYAEDIREDGTFVVKYSPETPDAYSDRIKIQVRNDVIGTNFLYQMPTNQRLKMRAGLPLPLNLGFAAGSSITDTQLIASSIDDAAILLRKLGPKNMYDSPIRNLEALHNPTAPVGAYHPYMGKAADVQLFIANSIATVTGTRIVSGAPGVKALSETGFPTPNDALWPGKMVGGTVEASEQQFIVYKDNTENSSAAFNALISEFGRVNIFFKIGDTIYLAGAAVEGKTYYYDAGTSQWQQHLDGTHAHNGAGGDGAYMFTCSPGLPFKLPKLDPTVQDTATSGDGYGSIQPAAGTVSGKDSTGRMLIHEVVVRRKRKKTLLL